MKLSMAAVIGRINRALRSQNSKLRRSRGRYLKSFWGDYYVWDIGRHRALETRVDPVRLAREMNLVRSWEQVEGVSS